MIAGLDLSELLELAALLVAVGALAGFLAGVFGIGGGAIPVPGFYKRFCPPRVPAGGADAALRRHIARHHHSDLDPVVSRPSRPRRRRYGHPARMVAAGCDRR